MDKLNMKRNNNLLAGIVLGAGIVACVAATTYTVMVDSNGLLKTPSNLKVPEPASTNSPATKYYVTNYVAQNSVSGSGAANQVALWNTGSALTGNNGLLYNSSTGVLALTNNGTTTLNISANGLSGNCVLNFQTNGVTVYKMSYVAGVGTIGSFFLQDRSGATVISASASGFSVPANLSGQTFDMDGGNITSDGSGDLNAIMFSVGGDDFLGQGFYGAGGSGVIIHGNAQYEVIFGSSVAYGIGMFPYPGEVVTLGEPTNAFSTVYSTNVYATAGLTVGSGTTVTKILSATATLNFANLAAIGCEDLTIAVTGAALGDTVSLGVPNASVVANGTYSAWVSATDTVTVRFCTVVSGDPASGTFRATVTKF